MARTKTFDCVQMKWEIQQALAKRFAGLSSAQAAEAQRRLIEEDPELSAFLQRVSESRTTRAVISKD